MSAVIPNADPSLIDSLPDLVLSLGRDGTILGHGGGRSLPALAPRGQWIGQRLDAVWPSDLAQALMQLVRKAISSRATLDNRLGEADQTYRVRITAQGPTRALCVVCAGDAAHDADTGDSGRRQAPHLDRRGFLRQFQETLALSVLTEKPAAVIVMHLDGVEKIANIDMKLSEQAVTAAVLKLTRETSSETLALCSSLGQLTDSQLALVVATSDRRSIESFIEAIVISLRAPITIGNAKVELSPYAGVAVLGRDATSIKGLLDNARIAADEAMRSGAGRARFFSDTMKLRSLARQDIGRELRAAIDTRGIRARYTGRYELATGRRVALVSYLRWTHPLRGEVSPKELLSVAAATGASLALSRSLLERLNEDYVELSRHIEPDVRLSYGPLRQHLLHEEFLTDIERFLTAGNIPPARLEIRIPETTLIVLPPAFGQRLAADGVQLVVDEVGRGMGSLDQLARSPLWGMQLDRSWVEALCSDDLAHRVCRASIASAKALGLFPIAAGVDDADQRLALLALGCDYGSGDLYDTESLRGHGPAVKPGDGEHRSRARAYETHGP